MHLQQLHTALFILAFHPLYIVELLFHQVLIIIINFIVTFYIFSKFSEEIIIIFYFFGKIFTYLILFIIKVKNSNLFWD